MRRHATTDLARVCLVMMYEMEDHISKQQRIGLVLRLGEETEVSQPTLEHADLGPLTGCNFCIPSMCYNNMGQKSIGWKLTTENREHKKNPM